MAFVTQLFFLLNLLPSVTGFRAAATTTWCPTPRLSFLSKRHVRVAGDTQPEHAVGAKIVDEAEDAVILATFFEGSYGGDPSYPEGLVGDVQLEEMEEDVTQVTGLRFFPDGSVSYLQTDGPPPLKFKGEWACIDGGATCWVTLTRGFENERVTGASYEVTRVLVGCVEGSLGGEYATVAGAIRTPNDASMVRMGLEDEQPVGYFSLLRLPEDVDAPRDTLQVKAV